MEQTATTETTAAPAPAATTETTAAPAPAAPAPAPADWTAGLSEAQKLYVQNKGFKAPTDVLDSYQNYEKLQGVPKERLLKLPEKLDSPEMSEIYDRLGRPKDAAGYAFATPEGQKPNPEFTAWAQKQFHTLGLTKTQGEALAKQFNEMSMNLEKQKAEAYTSKLASENEALRKEWGQAHDQNIKATQKAVQTFGLDEDAVQKMENALGYTKTMKLLADMGAKLGEDSFVTGGNSNFNKELTPGQAKARLDVLRQDREWVSRALSKRQPEFDEYTRLNKAMAPGEI